MVQTQAHPHSTTILGEPGSPKRDVLYIYNGKEGRKEPLQLSPRIIRAEPATYRSAPPRADRVIKATLCDWLLATTNVDFARTLHNFRLTDSIFESVRRLLSWSGQQHTNVLASLRPAYITQLLGVSRQIIRHLGVSRLMYCKTPIFRVEEIFAIFANWDFARNFPPAKITSTANGISRNFPPAKFTSREIFLPAKIKL